MKYESISLEWGALRWDRRNFKKSTYSGWLVPDPVCPWTRVLSRKMGDCGWETPQWGEWVGRAVAEFEAL